MSEVRVLVPLPLSMNFTEKVKEFILKYNLISPEDTVLIGVSGGPDSMALLYTLFSLMNELNFNLAVCYVDHKLRPESKDEAKFVSEVAESLKLPFTLKEINIEEFRRGRTLEESARVARYMALEEARKENNGTRIAVAHHLDDQIETILMRIVRGTSIRGLRGIPVRNGNIIRPLLGVYREEILGFCGENNIRYVIDSSNLSTAFTRNRIRLELIPVLEQYNPKVKESLLRLSAQAEELDGFLSYLEDDLLKRYKISGDEYYIAADSIKSLPEFLKRRVIFRILVEVSPKPTDVREESYKMLTSLLDKSTGKILNLPGGAIAYRDYNGIRILRENPHLLPVYILNIPGVTVIDRLKKKITTEIISKKELFEMASPNQYTFYLDSDKIELPIYLRGPKEGERFSPLGLNGKMKKLQDIMVDRKIPREYRGIYPVIVDNRGEVICIPEYTISERVKVDEGTKNILLLRIECYE